MRNFANTTSKCMGVANLVPNLSRGILFRAASMFVVVVRAAEPKKFC